jgi:hypothetical protein
VRNPRARDRFLMLPGLPFRDMATIPSVSAYSVLGSDVRFEFRREAVLLWALPE